MSTMDDAEAPAEARDMPPYTSNELRDESIDKHRIIDEHHDSTDGPSEVSALIDDEDLLRTVQEDLHEEEERRRASSPRLESALRERTCTPNIATPLECRSPGTEKGPGPSEAAVMCEPVKKVRRKRDRYYVMQMYESVFGRSEVIDEPAMKLRSKKKDYADTQSGYSSATPPPKRSGSSVNLSQSEPGSPYVKTAKARNCNQALLASPRRATRKEMMRVLRDGKRISSLPVEVQPRERRRDAKKGVDSGSGETIRELQKPNVLYPSPPKSLREKDGVTTRDRESMSEGRKGGDEYKSGEKKKGTSVIAMTPTSISERAPVSPDEPDEPNAESAAENTYSDLVDDAMLTTTSTPQRPHSAFLCVGISPHASSSSRASRRVFFPRRAASSCLYFFCRPDRLRRTRRTDNPAMCRIVLNDIWAYRMRDEVLGLTTKKKVRRGEESMVLKGGSMRDGKVGRTSEGPCLKRNLVKVQKCGDDRGGV